MLERSWIEMWRTETAIQNGEDWNRNIKWRKNKMMMNWNETMRRQKSRSSSCEADARKWNIGNLRITPKSKGSSLVYLNLKLNKNNLNTKSKVRSKPVQMTIRLKNLQKVTKAGCVLILWCDSNRRRSLARTEEEA